VAVSEGKVGEVAENAEAIEAWDGVLFDRWVKYRHIFVNGLAAHGEEALRLHPPQPGDRVVDLGCGLGDTTVRIAELVGPDGECVGVDSGARFIEQAREEAAKEDVENASFEVADVEAEVPGSDYDRAFSRMGTMFFNNPVAALRNVRAVLKPGGTLSMVVWRQKPDNDWVHRAELIAQRYLSHPDETNEPTCGPGPFSMANADTTSGILRSAGYEEIALTRCDLPIFVGKDADEAIEVAVALGPAAELIRINEERGEELRPKIEAEIRDEVMSGFERPDGTIWGGASTWIVSARVPAA